MINKMDLGSLVRIVTVNNELYEGIVEEKGKGKFEDNLWDGFVEIRNSIRGTDGNSKNVNYFINVGYIISIQILDKGKI